MTDSIISNEFGVNLGQVVVETYRLIDEEPALAELSLSELRSRLENEGLPIDVVIEQLSIFSDSNNNFLNTFLLQVKPRLDEPNGLQILTDSIDGQSPEISGKIHQLLDESVQSSLSIDKVAGGSGSIRHPLYDAVGIVAVGCVTKLSLALRKKKIELRETESRGVQAAENDSQAAAKDIFSDNLHLIRLARVENVSPIQTVDKAEIRLIKDAKRYTEKEIDSLLKPFVDGSNDRFSKATRGLEAEELKLVKLKMVDKLILNDAMEGYQRVLSLPMSRIEGATAEEQLDNLNIGVNERAELLRANVRQNPGLLEEYMNRRLLEPYREAFDRVADNDGKLILKNTRRRLDRDIENAFKKVGIEAKRKAAEADELAKFESEVESDFAKLDAKIETRVDNAVEDAIGEEEDFIDGLVIDLE